MKKVFIIAIFLAFLILGCRISNPNQVASNDSFLANDNKDVSNLESEKSPGPKSQNNLSVPSSSPTAVGKEIKEISVTQPTKEADKTQTPPLTSLDYLVSFTPQAPYAVWDQLHEEACEEASMIMAASYFKSETLTAHIAEQAILNLVKWEEGNGYQIDLTAMQTAEILRSYFRLKAELIYDVSLDSIKKQLASGRLLIIPVAGRVLKNPYFKQPGPIYHMLVIRGYDGEKIITNDPGTKRGEKYIYSYSALIDAVHDWDNELAGDGMTENEILQGQKVMVAVYQ